jgi:high-affinity iron transporter
MGNTLFIVWRESVEAILVIGILYAWLKNNDEARRGLPYLWGGVAAGLGLAGLLATVMLTVQNQLSGEALEYFQVAMMLAAAALIVQMVLWMHRHGRTLKRNLESGMEQASRQADWWGIVALVAIAVGREGAETVVFLYGIGIEHQGMRLAQFLFAAAAGFGLALLTAWLLARGGRYISWRNFFRLSETALLLLGAGLLVSGVEKLIAADWLPALANPVWDSSFLLDDGTPAGGIIASLTGYRAHPALMLVLAYAAYWGTVFALMRQPRPQRHALQTP